MKKQYYKPEMDKLSVDSCDVIATSGEQDDIMNYDDVWKKV